MDISVLLPTRNRPDLLLRSLSSLLNLAEKPEAIEFLLAVDPDAPAELPCGQGQVWTAPERFGPTRMHEYYNHLATLASGDSLMLWNDDAFMFTPGWDSHVRGNPEMCLWLDHGSCGPPQCNMFPVWPRAWTEAIGHIADGSPRVDTWIQEIAELLGRQVKVPVLIWHASPNDLTWRECRRPEDYRLPEFHDLRPLRAQEAQRLKELGF